MHIAEIINIIEQMAPLQGAASWDVSGLQVAAHRTDATRLAVCLDPSPASVSAALELGAQCILSHHPLALKPSLPNRIDHYHEVLRLLLTNDVPLYAAHTSLDVNSDGPVSWLARELHLDNLAVLEPTGPGTGDLPHGFAWPRSGRARGPAAAGRHAGRAHRPEHRHRQRPLPGKHPAGGLLHRFGILPAGGGRAAGADIFITGDVKYHTALDTQLCLFDVGHHSLEEEMMRRAAIHLQHACPMLEVVFVPSASPFQPVHPRVL